MASKLIQQPTEIKEGSWVKLRKHIRGHWYVYSCGVLALLAAILFMLHRYYSIKAPVDGAILGQYGDFIGGVLGTLISVLSVYYLIKTLREQHEGNIEVSANNGRIAEVYKLQQFDDNFTTLFNMYKDAIGAYQYRVTPRKIIRGREALIQMTKKLFDEFEAQDNYANAKLAAQQKFDEGFYIPNRDVASVHFRTLYQLFALISTSPIEESKKVLYAKMVRSQLCEEELLLLRYNCHCHYGIKMRKYVNLYNLLKHLPLLSLGEFKTWKDFLSDVQKINRIDTEFIALRKYIFNVIKGKVPENKVIIKNYSAKYSIRIQAKKDNTSLELCLTRNNSVETNETISFDTTFDTFSTAQLEELFSMFFLELFVYSNFAEYNNPKDISVETSVTNHSTSNKTSIKVVINKEKYPLALSYDELYSPQSGDAILPNATSVVELQS